MRLQICFIIFALLLAGFVFAQQPGPATGGDTLREFAHDITDYAKNSATDTLGFLWQDNNCDDPWTNTGGIGIISTLIPTIIAVMAVVFFTTCVYMFGQLMQSPQLIAFAKNEYWESGWTTLRLLLFFGLLLPIAPFFAAFINPNDVAHAGIYDGVPTLPDGTPSTLHIDLAMAFSKNMIFKISENISVLLLYNTVLHTLYSATMWFGITWRAMWSFNLGPVLKPLIDLAGMALQFLFVALGEWVLHLITLCAIKKWTWSLFIPIAILIRSFPPTRGGGDAMIALFLSLVMVYPVMFIIDAEVYRVTKSYLTSGSDTLSAFFSGGIFGSIGLLAVVMLLMGGAFVPFMLNGAVSIAFELIKNAIYFIVIMGFVLPFINIFVTLTAAREIAKAYGTDVNFMAFVRLI